MRRKTQKIAYDRDSNIFFEKQDFIKFEEQTRRILFFVFLFLKKKNVQCDIFFLTTTSIRRIYFQYKGKNKGTTVLSFVAKKDIPHPEIKKGHAFLGEIYIAPTYILRVKKEVFGRYLIHGILHLCGYTHTRVYDRMQMEALEKKIIQALQEQKIISPNF